MSQGADASALLWDLYSSADNPVLRATLTPIASDPSGFSKRFYGHLFRRSPGLRTLFPEDMEQQYLKLAQTLCVVVSGLDQPKQIVPGLEALGARHRGYGVRPSHYRLMGQALMASLGGALGDAWTPEYTQAWSEAFELIAQTMIEGAAEVRIAAAMAA